MGQDDLSLGASAICLKCGRRRHSDFIGEACIACGGMIGKNPVIEHQYPLIVAVEVKPTLAGLAYALNTLLAKGAEHDAEVSCGVFEEDGQRGSLLFDGMVDVETNETLNDGRCCKCGEKPPVHDAQKCAALPFDRRAPGIKVRVILSTSEDYEVREALAKEAGSSPEVPPNDSELATVLRKPRPFGELSPSDYGRLAEAAKSEVASKDWCDAHGCLRQSCTLRGLHRIGEPLDEDEESGS